MGKLRDGSGSRERLTAWIDDPRPFVALKSSDWLYASSQDDETVKILKRFADRRKREGADEKELAAHARGILFTEQAIAEKRVYETKDETEIGRLVAKLSEGRSSARNLVPLLYDPRSAVVREATYWLMQAEDPVLTEQHWRRVQRIAEERKKAGAPLDELARYAHAIRVIEMRWDEDEKKQNQKKGDKKP